MRLTFIALIILITSNAVWALESKGGAKETIVLVGTEATKASFHGRWLDLIYTEVFRRLGYELEYLGYPAARASTASDAGEVDGEIHRVSNYHDLHPNLIRVDEPHFSVHFNAYTVNPQLKVEGWKALSGSSLRVGYRRGVMKTESMIPMFLPHSQIEMAFTIDQGLLQALYKRVDMYIDVKANVEEVLKQQPHKLSAIREVGTLEEIPTHCFLHNKRAELVPEVEAMLIQLKTENLISHFREQAFQ